MIIMSIITIVLAILSGIMGLLPNIPEMPNVVKDGVDLIFSYMVSITGFVAYLMTPPLLVFILTGTIVMLSWSLIYNGFMWVIRKLPVVGIE